MSAERPREQWASRTGLILAAAGSAIGLANFLRFPVQAAKNGGGAFMIPYMVSLVLLGIPLIWTEWSLGRYIGGHGSGTTVAVFDKLWHKPYAKYLGLFGVVIPLIIMVYFVYIESWTLAYSIFNITGAVPQPSVTGDSSAYFVPFNAFLASFLGTDSPYKYVLIPSLMACTCFVITLAANLYVLHHGIVSGIEKLSKIAVPAIFALGFLLLVRVFLLRSPDGLDVFDGLGFLWNPDAQALADPAVWLAAAGQIFFTLSIGVGSIVTYASYVKPKTDVALSGLATISLNEISEVILGGSIAIVASVILFGSAATFTVANEGAFGLAFVSMPAVFASLPFGALFGFAWFLLLFLAGIAASVSLGQPFIAFLEDEFKIRRERAVLALGIFLLVSGQIPIWLRGALDELDFWAGTFALVVLALLEIVLFMWVFGSQNAWRELTTHADITVPRVFYYIMKYVSIVFLLVILIAWIVLDLPENVVRSSPIAWIARVFFLAVVTVGFGIIYKAQNTVQRGG